MFSIPTNEALAEVPGAMAFLATMAFLFGTVWGSFLNVCIYRVPLGKSVVKPDSHCYACGSPVRWYDNIPVVSYLLLRGQCRDCGSAFSPRYMLVELLTGCLFLAVFLTFGVSLVTLLHWVFVAMLIVGTFTDIDHFIIPDGITLGGFVFAVVASTLAGADSVAYRDVSLTADIWVGHSRAMLNAVEWNPHLTAFLGALWGAAFGWLLLWGVAVFGRLLFRKDAMGGGDIKLFAFLGAYLGAWNCLYVLFLAAFLGAVLGLSMIAAHKLVGRDEFDELAFDFGPADKAVDAEPTATETVVRFPFARRTARQMHHFPFGPYIAVAAVVMLFVTPKLERLIRDMFLLP